MAIDQERVKNHIISAEVTGDTLRINAVPHIVTESEESRRKNRDVLADRATIAGAAERGFFGRMWYGLTETYQRLRRRDALRELHDNGNDINLGSAALDRAKDQVREMVAQERDEITATAISRNVSNDIGRGDMTHVLDEETAGTERDEEIILWARSIISEYATGQIDQARMQELSENLSCELRDALPDLFAKTTIGSDLVYIAESARDAYVANQERIKNLDLDLQICFGRVDAGMATAEKRDFADKIVDWSQGGRARAVLVNPFTIGATASAVAFGAKAPFKSVPVIGGIAGGAFAAVRRWSKENKDRDLRIREEEIGYEIPEPAQHAGVERVLSGLVGQTDFRKTSYQPRSALEMREEFERLSSADAAEKGTQTWQENALNLLADTSVRLDVSDGTAGLIRYGQRRDANGQVEVSGISTINQDRLALILAARETQRQLVGEIGQNDFDTRYEAVESRILEELEGCIKKADSNFHKSRALMSFRSGLFGAGVGITGGFAIHEVGEGIEHVSRRVADVFHQAHEQRVVTDQKDVSLGHGNVINADATAAGHQGLQVDVASGVNAHFDAAKHTLSVDVPANGADAAKHFDIAYQPGMNADEIHAALVKAGLDGKVDILHSAGVPHLSTEDILRQDYLAQHHLVDVTNQPHGIDFGHAQFLGDKHEYNELTLYQQDATHWSMGPHGLDGSALKPFVYKNEPAWPDPSIAANAPVNPDSLVAFYQITDSHGQLHTILAPQNGGHFTLPQEFVDPATGKVDGVSIIGYGMVKDAHGKLIDGNQVIAHPELMNGATLHSMASVPLEQKGHMISQNLSTVKISDLTAHVTGQHTETVEASNKFVFDIPPIATPFAPRLFPNIAEPPVPPEPPYYAPGEGYQKWIESRDLNRTKYIKSDSGIWVDPEGNPVVRDVARERQEVSDYLSSQEDSYREELNSVADSLPEMSDEARVVICIPARMEEKNIKRLLDMYTRQVGQDGLPLDPSLYEINILSNGPEGEQIDNTVKVVQKFHKKHPQFRVVVIDKAFPKDKASVGLARKYLTDLALVRSLRRNGQAAPLYIQSEDADLVNVDPKTVVRLIDKFDADPAIDALRGKQDRNPDVLMNNDLLFFQRRLWDFGEIMLRSKKYREGSKGDFTWNRVVTGGWNTAFSAEVYALIGGYNENARIGEDMDIGNKISLIRGDAGEPNVETIKTVASRTDSSPRRFIKAIAERTNPYDNFDDQTFKKLKDGELLARIRAFARISEENKGTFETYATGNLAFLVSVLKDQDEANKLFRRVMGFVGFRNGDFEIENGHVKILNINNFKASVNSYREKKQTESIRKVVRKVWRRGSSTKETKRENTLGMSKENFEEAARFAATKSSAEQEKRSLYEWMVLLSAARDLGVESEDDEELDYLSGFLPSNRAVKLSGKMAEKMTKHAAIAEMSRMSQEPPKVSKLANIGKKVVQSVPVAKKLTARTS